jgi:hypothetical protein
MSETEIYRISNLTKLFCLMFRFFPLPVFLRQNGGGGVNSGRWTDGCDGKKSPQNFIHTMCNYIRSISSDLQVWTSDKVAPLVMNFIRNINSPISIFVMHHGVLLCCCYSLPSA